MEADEQRGTAVVGLGYVGLAVAVSLAKSGVQVHGIDRDPSRIHALRSGVVTNDECHAPDLRRSLGDRLHLWTSLAEAPAVDAYVICVATPLSDAGAPDLTAVRDAAASIAAVLRPGNLVVLESTVSPGTTEGIVQPILETSGLSAGIDFDLAYSPERVDPGNTTFDVTNTPKIVAGIDERSTKRAAALYEGICDEVVVAEGVREAELSKLVENSYRQLNIAFVNELAQVCAHTGIDLSEALRCASTKPFGFESFLPGAGVGGQCIPIDPRYLNAWVEESVGRPLVTIDGANRVNGDRPLVVADRVRQCLESLPTDQRKRRLLVVGVAYKTGSPDVRNSPALDFHEAVQDLDVDILFWDPIVRSWAPGGEPLEFWDVGNPMGPKIDVAVVLQCHDSKELSALVQLADVVVDATGRVPGATRI